MSTQAHYRHDVRGSLWHRWDLHFHTPSSFEYENKGVSNEQIVKRLIDEKIRVVAVTDHHIMDVKRIQELQRLAGEQLTILPGIELRDSHGGEPIHYICIFPDYCDLENVWTKLQGKLGLTPADVLKKGDDKVYCPIDKSAEIVRELRGVISIHAGAKSNSIEGISNKEKFQQRIKYDITNDYVDIMEIGQLKDIDTHLKIIFPDTGLDKPLIICSDNHDVINYKVKAPLWLRADPTFRGLLMMIREPRDRVFIGDRPPQLVRIEQNSTKYVRSISFQLKEDAQISEKWFSKSIFFNPGLVAIIGNKGSGKSALADTLGLLGSSKNADWFSFLCEERFCHPVKGYAKHFEATLEWESGEKFTRCLADHIKPEEVERLKYLPQDHVERVCNEIIGIGEEGFEQELKSVIFSHVPDAQRLGYRTLDKLIQFRTGEKQKRIDSLLKQLRDVSRSRVMLETENDPAVKRHLLEQIRRRELELEAHDKAKPTEKPDPSTVTAPSEEDAALLQSLAATEETKKSVNEQIAKEVDVLGKAERRFAVAGRLVEKLENFQEDFNNFKDSLEEDVLELGMKVDDLVTLSMKSLPVKNIQDEESKTIDTAKKMLDDDVDTPGLQKQLRDIEASIIELQSSLDAPIRAYQAYTRDLDDWQRNRDIIIGSGKEPESLGGLKVALSALDDLPSKIAVAKAQQSNLALLIQAEKLAQATVYRDLYGPVQVFIDTHELAKDKLKLEFRVELTNEDFVDRLLGLLALNRRGSFMGIEDGHARAEAFVKFTKWDETESVRTFLQNVDDALHQNQRENPQQPTQLKEQIHKGKSPEEVFNLLYGMEYIRPKYILRWEGKDLSMLSPGERGTLLLVFYLLIEKGEVLSRGLCEISFN